jgi:hypothetical protein
MISIRRANERGHANRDSMGHEAVLKRRRNKLR